MDRQLQIMIVMPWALLCLVYVLGSVIAFTPTLSPQEREILGFVPENLVLPERKGAYKAVTVQSPIEIRSAPNQPDKAAGSAPIQSNKVTMIIIGGLRKLAMINNMLVTEDDAVGSIIVQRIESNRVLVRESQLDSGGKSREQTQWLYLEDKQ